MNIALALHARAAAHPDLPAIIDTYAGRGRVTTFGALEGAAAQAAQMLWEAGLRPGDRALVLQPISAELYVALLAIFRLGVVATFVDPSSGTKQVERCCALAAPHAFIGSAKAHVLRLLAPSLGRIPRKFVVGASALPIPGATPWERASGCLPREAIYDAAPDDPALLTFTSGSTGAPKAMVRSHAFLLAQHRVLEREFPARPGAVSLTTLPIFVLADLASGMTSLIAAGDLRRPGAIDAAPVLAQIARYHPIRASASPAFWERIVAYCQQRPVSLREPSPTAPPAGSANSSVGARLVSPSATPVSPSGGLACMPASPALPHIEALYAGGAPVFPRLLDALQALAPDAAVVAVYGSTEAEPIAHIARSELQPGDVPAMLAGRGLLVGTPVPEIALRILRDQWGAPVGPYTPDEFAADCLTAGEAGEIVVRGEHVSGGYLGGRGDDETKFLVDSALWHRTGDTGYLDERGRLWLLGRCSARITDSRGTLYPFAVEAALSAHPELRRSAAVALGGRRILALELAPQVDAAQLAAIIKTVAWAAFDDVRVLPHLPVDKRHNAKIDYPALYKLLST